MNDKKIKCMKLQVVHVIANSHNIINKYNIDTGPQGISQPTTYMP